GARARRFLPGAANHEVAAQERCEPERVQIELRQVDLAQRLLEPPRSATALVCDHSERRNFWKRTSAARSAGGPCPGMTIAKSSRRPRTRWIVCGHSRTVRPAARSMFG